jgi:hypothetical protein
MRKRKCVSGIAVALAVAAAFGSCFLFEGGEEPPGKTVPAAKTYAVSVVETEHGVITAPARAVPGSMVAIQAAPDAAGEVDGNVQGGGD